MESVSRLLFYIKNENELTFSNITTHCYLRNTIIKGGKDHKELEQTLKRSRTEGVRKESFKFETTF